MMRQRWDHVDTNSDGFLDNEEQAAIIERMKQFMGGNRGGPGGMRPGGMRPGGAGPGGMRPGGGRPRPGSRPGGNAPGGGQGGPNGGQ